MAFLDPQAPGLAACRAYLVTAEQLADVAAQEMHRPPGGEFAQALVGLLGAEGEVRTLGGGRYETIARLGDLDGAPMFTVTHHRPAQLAPAPPSAAYLRTISVGLRETHGWGPDRVAGYLLAARGVEETWSRTQLRALVATATDGRTPD